LRNSLKSLNLNTDNVDPYYLSERAEQLGVAQWVELTNQTQIQ
jgi:hypothetical protein